MFMLVFRISPQYKDCVFTQTWVMMTFLRSASVSICSGLGPVLWQACRPVEAHSWFLPVTVSPGCGLLRGNLGHDGQGPGVVGPLGKMCAVIVSFSHHNNKKSLTSYLPEPVPALVLFIYYLI